jgi:colanic acid/amylovoran biosynthesis glycosyltransferase
VTPVPVAESRTAPSPRPVTRTAAKIAYLCSEYPAISHTFVLREVEALRRLGAEIATFSIRRTPAERQLAEADRRAAETTKAILPAGPARLLATHLRLFAKRPAGYLAGLAFALRLARPGLRGHLWQLFYFAEAGLLLRACAHQEIRHVHVHLANPASDVAMLTARLGNAIEPGRRWSWSFTMHGPTEFFDVHRSRLAEKVEDARFVVCISDFARSQLMTLCGPDAWERLHVVHMGIPVADFTRAAPAPAGSRPMILYIGRLVPEKGQTVLLDAVAELARRGCEAEVTLAGGGDLQPALERLAAERGIADRVSFLGAVGQDRLHDLYGRAAVFCLPSFAEGVPVVLMEAMAMEVPVVSTRIAGISELIAHGEEGMLVAPGRADQLADTLESLVSDRQRRRELGRRGREKVLREFDAERCAEQLLGLFARQLGPPGGGA